MVLRRSVLFALVIGLFAISNQDVLAQPELNLTGTWRGHQVGRDSTKTILPATVCCEIIQISQSGEDTFYLAFGEDPVFRYTGKLIPDPKNPSAKGQIMFVSCTTTNALPQGTEVGKGHITSLTFKAESLFFDGRMWTYDWQYRKVDSTDPGIGACDD